MRTRPTPPLVALPERALQMLYWWRIYLSRLGVSRNWILNGWSLLSQPPAQTNVEVRISFSICLPALVLQLSCVCVCVSHSHSLYNVRYEVKASASKASGTIFSVLLHQILLRLGRWKSVTLEYLCLSFNVLGFSFLFSLYMWVTMLQRCELLAACFSFFFCMRFLFKPKIGKMWDAATIKAITSLILVLRCFQSRRFVNLRFCNNQSFCKLDSLYSFAWNHFWSQRSGRSETVSTGDFLQESRALRSTFFPSLSFWVFGFSWKLGFGVHLHFCWVLSRSASTRNVVQICRASKFSLLLSSLGSSILKHKNLEIRAFPGKEIEDPRWWGSDVFFSLYFFEKEKEILFLHSARWHV